VSSAKRKPLPFDKHGGVVAIQRGLIESTQFLALKPHAKALIVLMQLHWSNERPVAYGIREAAEKIPCDRKTAMRSFSELENAGFIVLVDESLFDSRAGSRSRTWRLTWLPFRLAPPTNDWKNKL
jgi:hypothetical protein